MNQPVRRRHSSSVECTTTTADECTTSNSKPSMSTIKVVIRYYKQNKYKALALILLAKGFVIALVALFYIYRSKDEPDVKACVVQNKLGLVRCQMFPCQGGVDGKYHLVDAPHPNFGYAGHFVHRVKSETKLLPQSEYLLANDFVLINS